MTYAPTFSKNAGSCVGVDNFGANQIETSGLINAGTLKIGGTTATVGTAVVGLPGTVMTQTYSTAQATVPNATYSVYTVTTVATAVTKTNSSPYGFSSGDADKVVTALGAIPTDLAGMQVEIAALAADVLALKKIINQIIDDLQVTGIEA